MKQTSFFGRFLIAFALVLLLMGIFAGGILILVLADVLGDGPESLAIVFGTIFLFVIVFIPYMNVIGRVAFHFNGEGRPVSIGKLERSLLDINKYKAPVMTEKRDDRLVITWKYVDAKWWEIFAKAGLKEVYELHIKFNEKKKKVVLIDIKKSVSWKAGPSEVSLRGGFFRGIMLEYSIGKQWGIKENFKLGKIYDYKFVSQEIKNPVLNTILRNGWDVEFGMW